MSDDLRAKVLAIFGVTEEELAAIDDGYSAAKAEADAERAAYVELVKERLAEVAAGMDRALSR